MENMYLAFFIIRKGEMKMDQIEMINTGKLIPYEKNPRINEESVLYVANSIREFGFKQPIVVDKNMVVIVGHTRLKAAISLGIKQVPVIIAEDLSEEQVNAYRIADNSAGESSKWDFDFLEEELLNIPDFNMAEFGLDLSFLDESEEPEEKENERERTYDAYNLYEFDPDRAAGKYQMPVIEKENHIPEKLIGFNYALTSQEYEAGIHFYIDDYQFERIWNEPYKYVEKLQQFDCVLTPDFSLYMDMPLSMKIWNTYRSRMIGQIMQDNGIIVIPTLSWAEPETFDFCFDGIEPGGTVSVSTVGVVRNKDSYDIWCKGMQEAIDRLHPTGIVLYGNQVEFDFGDIEAVNIANTNVERMMK